MSKSDKFKQTDRSQLALGQDDEPSAIEAVDRAIYDGDIGGIDWAKVSKQAQEKAIQATSGDISVGGFTLTHKGAVWLDDDAPSKDNWQEALTLTFRIESGLQWIIGDLVAFGESVGYGDAQIVAELFGKKPQTLYNYTSVCRAFPEISRRRENLSFGHHEAVAGIKTAKRREKLLQQAEDEGWSVSRLRQEIRDTPKLPDDTRSESLKIQRRRMSKIVGFISQAQSGELTVTDREKALGEIAAARRWLDEIENEFDSLS